MKVKICFNQESEALLNAVSKVYRGFVIECQQRIEASVLAVCPNAVSTSGYRSPGYNARVSRIGEKSNHLWGCARDYRRDTVDAERLASRLGSDYQVIDEPGNGCVHVELR